MWRDRLVFHDLTKVTTLFIHLVPPLFSFCVRWNDPEMWVGSSATENRISVKDVRNMMIFYVLWQFLYLLKTCFLDRDKLNGDAELMTSARWMCEYKPHPIYRRLSAWGLSNGTAALSFFQFFFTLTTLLVVSLMYENYVFNIAAILFTLLRATWYGATYYFEEFAVRYTESLENALAGKKTGRKGKEGCGYLPHFWSVVQFFFYFAFCFFCFWCLLHVLIWV
eukprot:TRINITY_DN10671_c0_g1_i1.p1 TRINITY_DN10671_c0_g1~~TRINITY_DN10671_c0_g1_i1.p1  ORF type:complete len:223 (+),score=35.01 TRINITY_DN10671_c0_g1_i1:197-865(+)